MTTRGSLCGRRAALTHCVDGTTPQCADAPTAAAVLCMAPCVHVGRPAAVLAGARSTLYCSLRTNSSAPLHCVCEERSMLVTPASLACQAGDCVMTPAHGIVALLLREFVQPLVVCCVCLCWTVLLAEVINETCAQPICCAGGARAASGQTTGVAMQDAQRWPALCNVLCWWHGDCRMH
jgi:hypothetical protein